MARRLISLGAALLFVTLTATVACSFDNQKSSNGGDSSITSYQPPNNLIVVGESSGGPPDCNLRDVVGLVSTFIGAFNKGDSPVLRDVFADERGFEWYSVTEGDPDHGGRHFVTYDKSGLAKYFAERHLHHESLRLLMMDVAHSAYTASTAFTLARTADDLTALGIRNDVAVGKAEIRCLKKPELFVWSMGMSATAGDPSWPCPKPEGWTREGPPVACSRR